MNAQLLGSSSKSIDELLQLLNNVNPYTENTLNSHTEMYKHGHGSRDTSESLTRMLEAYDSGVVSSSTTEALNRAYEAYNSEVVFTEHFGSSRDDPGFELSPCCEILKVVNLTSEINHFAQYSTGALAEAYGEIQRAVDDGCKSVVKAAKNDVSSAINDISQHFDFTLISNECLKIQTSTELHITSKIGKVAESLRNSAIDARSRMHNPVKKNLQQIKETPTFKDTLNGAKKEADARNKADRPPSVATSKSARGGDAVT